MSRLVVDQVGVGVGGMYDVRADTARGKDAGEIVDIARDGPLGVHVGVPAGSIFPGSSFFAVSINAAVEPVAMIDAPSPRCGERRLDGVDDPDQIGVDGVAPGVELG